MSEIEMKNELQTAIVDLINKTVSATGQATDFILAETPEFIQQLLMWKMVNSIVVSFCGVFILWLVYFVSAKIYKGWAEICKKELEVMVVVLGTVSAIMAIPMGLVYATDLLWLKIWIAPKVYLVEYAASLIK